MDFELSPLSDRKTSTAEADALAREILKHRQDDKNASYLGRFMSDLSSPIHGKDKTLARLEALQTSNQLARLSGNSNAEEETRKEMRQAISNDRAARKTADSWVAHGSGFVKSLGFFCPGETGYVMSVLSGAADAARPEDSLLRQGGDLVLGAGKGFALKYTFDRDGESKMNLALKAAT
ncbi:MAG: hypothetical protein K2X27_07935, partial [Candidatus Obscuribacterales bacterium]|nr:hypothetical protein [Candidatus Obscuribacterales bacterium]